MKYKDIVEFIQNKNSDISQINERFKNKYTIDEINFCILNIDTLSKQISNSELKIKSKIKPKPKVELKINSKIESKIISDNINERNNINEKDNCLKSSPTNNTDIISNQKINKIHEIPSVTEDKKEQKIKRVYQKEFRKEIIKKYGKCVVSCAHNERCEASHIVPFAEDKINKYNIDNGILLRADLHKLFDKYLVSINPTTNTFIINKNYLENDPSLIKYNNIKINNRFNTNTLRFLRQHYDLFIKYNC
jgi:hypothetical protein